MRLIDADALTRSMYLEAFESDSDRQRWDSGCWIRYKMFEDHRDAQSTVDAIPVEWVCHQINALDEEFATEGPDYGDHYVEYYDERLEKAHVLRWLLRKWKERKEE